MQMPFGKYRGTHVRELPFNYLEWLTTLELSEPLRTGVREEYEKRLDDQSRYERPIDLDMVDELGQEVNKKSRLVMKGNPEKSLFDALRIAEATAKSLAVDAEEFRILKTKSAE